MPIGDRWVSRLSKILKLFNLPTHTALENLLLVMMSWVWPCRRSGSAIWTDPSKSLSAYRRLLQISRILWFSAWWLIIMWMASLSTSCPEESCSQSYISSQCLENRVKGHSSHVTIAVYIHCESNNHHQANISYVKAIDQDSKQVAREAMHPRKKQPSTHLQHRKNVHSRNL